MRATTIAQALPRICRHCCRRQTTMMGTTTIARGGSVGLALAKMLLDDTTVVLASAPDSDCNCEDCAARAEAGPIVASRPCRRHQCRSWPSTSATVEPSAVAALNIFASCVRSAVETVQDSPLAPGFVDDGDCNCDNRGGLRRSRRGGEWILAVTFTKKSMGEMERRLAEVLLSAAVGRVVRHHGVFTRGGGEIKAHKMDY